VPEGPPKNAEEVLVALGMWRVPVDPFKIAEEEGIELAPGCYGLKFDARIEYSRDIDNFILYYREPGPDRSPGRVRFSIAHELGHFYLPAHRERIEKGQAHNSTPDFRSPHPIEREADEFAASLLMPPALFVAAVRRFRQCVCILAEICTLAEDVFGTSITSTAIRYCEHDLEPCAVAVSGGRKIRWARCSESMRRLGMGFIPSGSRVPPTSATARLWDAIESGAAAGAVEGATDARAWYERPYRQQLWEEAMPLGRTGLALTYLTLEDGPPD